MVKNATLGEIMVKNICVYKWSNPIASDKTMLISCCLMVESPRSLGPQHRHPAVLLHLPTAGAFQERHRLRPRGAHGTSADGGRKVDLVQLDLISWDFPWDFHEIFMGFSWDKKWEILWELT